MPFTQTITTLATDVLNRLADATNMVWSPTEINAYLLEGYNRFVVGTAALWRRQPIGDVAAQALYTLPTDLAEIERATWNDIMIPPTERSLLQYSDPNFETRTGDVTTYVMEGDGLRVLRKVAIPTVTHATRFQIEYIRRGVSIGDRLLNGTMEAWTLATVPDSWTRVDPTAPVGAVAQQTPGYAGSSAQLTYDGFNVVDTGIYQDVVPIPGQRRHFEVRAGGGPTCEFTIQNLTTGNYLQAGGVSWGVGLVSLIPAPGTAYQLTTFDYTVESALSPVLRHQMRLDSFATPFTPKVWTMDDWLDYPQLELRDHFLKYVKFFALWKALEREGPGQDIAAAEHYRSRYERGVALTIAKQTAFRRSMSNAIGPAGPRQGGIPTPSLPSNFGRTIRVRRGRR